MSKQIKITDELYELLKGEADSNYRTITGQIQWLMDQSANMHYDALKMGIEPEYTPTPQVVKESLISMNISKGSDFLPLPPDPELGYPCCQSNKPCKHWQWDVNSVTYINTLTGKGREADI